MKAGIKFIAGIAAAFMISVYSGFVLSFIWDWFIHDTFGIKKISIIESIGVALCISMLTKAPSDDGKEIDIEYLCISSFSRSTAYLLIGFIYSQFI